MPYLVKKVAGLALVLLGGLTVAHASVSGVEQVMLDGLILNVLGAGLMVLKILRPNTFHTGRRQ